MCFNLCNLLIFLLLFTACEKDTRTSTKNSTSTGSLTSTIGPNEVSLLDSSPDDDILLDFYRQKPVKYQDRDIVITEFWNFSNDELESAHDYVQWLFPIEKTGMSPAPVMTKNTAAVMTSDAEIKKNILRSLDIFLKFMGYTRVNNPKCDLVRNADFEKRAKNWIIDNTHNHLRMTRLLKFLKYINLDSCTESLFAEFTKLKADKKYENYIPKNAFKYWQKARLVKVN